MKLVSERIRSFGLVPVLVVDSVDRAEPLGDALVEAGLEVAEVTFRTEAAPEVIKRISDTHPDMLIGAGTVLSVEDVQKAVDAGARFIVSPGMDPAIVHWCLNREILVTPGVATPTEITSSLNMGLEVLKFFPAEVLGGVSALKAIAGPFPQVRFIPSGGIGMQNAAAYLELSSVLAVGGTWFVKRDQIRTGKFDQIKQDTIEALELVRKARRDA
jgi:2-dehydro-3-deoxyphosphogluconate aldolase/(4S)-4-hydroxy-2-oxoglutarate aldolase